MLRETFEYDNIFAGNVMPVVTESVEVAESQTIAKYSIVELDASGKVVFPAGEIDVNKVYGITTEAIVTEAGENKPVVLFMTGEFNERKIVVPEGKTIAEYKPALRKLGIFLKTIV